MSRLFSLAHLFGSAFRSRPDVGEWRITTSRNGGEVRIFHRRGDQFPQCAALHLRDGYFRLAPGTGWGTSIVLPPTFWSRGKLFQGAPTQAEWHADGEKLRLELNCERGGLTSHIIVSLSLPRDGRIEARIEVATQGEVALDERPNEAFKLAMLSSMRVSSTLWDAGAMLLDGEARDFTDRRTGNGWALPATRASSFGLRGGNSDWKRDAPTVEIALDAPRTVACWRTPSRNPNDDNLAMWAASDQLLRSWSYSVTVSRGPSV